MKRWEEVEIKKEAGEYRGGAEDAESSREVESRWPNCGRV